MIRKKRSLGPETPQLHKRSKDYWVSSNRRNWVSLKFREIGKYQAYALFKFGLGSCVLNEPVPQSQE